MSELYSIQAKTGMGYLGNIDEELYDIQLDKKNEKTYIKSFSPSQKFIVLTNVILLIPVKGTDGKPDVLPQKFEDTPAGSTSIAINIDNINEINVLDENNKFAKAILAAQSGLLTANAGDIENSSRLIHKFGRSR